MQRVWHSSYTHLIPILAGSLGDEGLSYNLLITFSICFVLIVSSVVDTINVTLQCII